MISTRGMCFHVFSGTRRILRKNIIDAQLRSGNRRVLSNPDQLPYACAEMLLKVCCHIWENERSRKTGCASNPTHLLLIIVYWWTDQEGQINLLAPFRCDFMKFFFVNTIKLEIRDSQNLAKLGHGCTTKLIDGGRERIEFRFNWRCGWVATMVPICELRSTFWFPVVSM